MSIKSVFQYNRGMLKEWVATFGHDGLLLIWLTDEQIGNLIDKSYERNPDNKKKYVISNSTARKQIRNLKSLCKSTRTRWRPVIERMFANVKEEYYFAWEKLEQQGDFVPKAINFVIGLIKENARVLNRSTGLPALKHTVTTSTTGKGGSLAARVADLYFLTSSLVLSGSDQ